MKSMEKWFWLIGAMMLALYFGGQAWGESKRQRDLENFAGWKLDHIAEPSALASTMPAIQTDLRIDSESTELEPGNRSTVAHGLAEIPVAVLRIPRLSLEVPVGTGTDESVLLHGAGWIDGTASPGSVGNVGIAAHRDSFFRSLKDVAVGDLIELESLNGTDRYRVAELSIVEPSEVGVLADSGAAELTLVTCYPFYFVGHAPQRFIVRAVATGFRS